MYRLLQARVLGMARHPDLAALELRSEQTHRYVVELPPVLSKAEWQEKYGPIIEPTAALPGAAARQF